MPTDFHVKGLSRYIMDKMIRREVPIIYASSIRRKIKEKKATVEKAEGDRLAVIINEPEFNKFVFIVNKKIKNIITVVTREMHENQKRQKKIREETKERIEIINIITSKPTE